MNIRTVATAMMGVALVLSETASAASVVDGWYVQGGGGPNWQTGGDVELPG